MSDHGSPAPEGGTPLTHSATVSAPSFRSRSSRRRRAVRLAASATGAVAMTLAGFGAAYAAAGASPPEASVHRSVEQKALAPLASVTAGGVPDAGALDERVAWLSSESDRIVAEKLEAQRRAEQAAAAAAKKAAAKKAAAESTTDPATGHKSCGKKWDGDGW